MGRCACTRRHRKTSFPPLTSDEVSHLSVLITAPLTMLETQVGFDVGALADVGFGAECEVEAPIA